MRREGRLAPRQPLPGIRPHERLSPAARRPSCAQARTAPRARLAAFLRASLDPVVLDPRVFGLWAGFIALVRVDPAFEAVHREGYLAYRGALEPLIADAAGAGADAPRLATQLNALMDGLWIEGCMLPADFDADALARLALDGAARLLGFALED